MLAEGAFHPAVVPCRFGEEPLESLGSEVLANTEDVSIPPDHFL